MPNVISKDTSLPLFADDSKCFRLILGQTDGDELEDDLNKLSTWSYTWGMEFNTACTKRRNVETKRPKRNDRNETKRPKRNRRNETTETKRPKRNDRNETAENINYRKNGKY
jgi:hypothetical protein